MGIHEALFSRLSGVAGVTTLVGSSPCRIYPDEAPQKPTLPYVVYFRVGSERPHAMVADTTIRRARFQFNCYASKSDDARALADAVIAALSRYSGTQATVVIDDIYIDNQIDGVDDDAKLKVSVVDIEVCFQR